MSTLASYTMTSSWPRVLNDKPATELRAAFRDALIVARLRLAKLSNLEEETTPHDAEALRMSVEILIAAKGVIRKIEKE